MACNVKTTAIHSLIFGLHTAASAVICSTRHSRQCTGTPAVLDGLPQPASTAARARAVTSTRMHTAASIAYRPLSPPFPTPAPRVAIMTQILTELADDTRMHVIAEYGCTQDTAVHQAVKPSNRCTAELGIVHPASTA